MTNKDDKTATQITAKLIENVYDDALAPIAQGFGVIGQAFMSLFSLRLEYRVERLKRLLEDTLKDVPEERRQQPHPAIAGPIFDNALLLSEDDPLREMFRRLLTQAIDKEYVHNAHPAFARIIAELAPDEAHLLFLVNKDGQINLKRRWLRKGVNVDENALIECEMPPHPWVLNYDHYDCEYWSMACLVFPSNTSMYFEHLINLALVVEAPYQNDVKFFVQSGYEEVVMVERLFRYSSTTFGSKFMGACLPFEAKVEEEGWGW